jgi:hypothetical protein
MIFAMSLFLEVKREEPAACAAMPPLSLQPDTDPASA